MSAEKFIAHFGVKPEHQVFSPGRVNLIGEHIDYCGGLVMPMAISRGTHGWIASAQEPVLEIYSERFNQTAELELKPGEPKGHWSDFAVGVISLLCDQYELSGLKMYVTDDIGAGGLSSSASFSLLLAHSLVWAAGGEIRFDSERLQLATICQQVEHDYVGVQCGIMDQASIALGGILSLNCNNLDYARINHLPVGYDIVVMDTCHARELAGSKYNERVAELSAIRDLIKGDLLGEDLCQLSSDQLPGLFPKIESSVLRRRLKHVVTENERVIGAKGALERDDVLGFGRLMNESHDSLQQDYEVTGHALELIVEASRSHSGSVGARMTGAGFGGCALALVKRSEVEAHNAHVAEVFERTTGVQPEVFAVTVGPAAG